MEPRDLAFNEQGLVPVIAQDAATGEVRMLAYADSEAVAKTLATREAHFFSRSRGRLWKKGEESGNVLRVHEVWTDCDRDAVVYLVEPAGPTCHTGEESCFFERISPSREEAASEASVASLPSASGRALPSLAKLDGVIASRTQADSAKSYTKSLFEGGPAKIADKVREEAGELAEALVSESNERVVSEAADTLFHLMVGLRARGLSLRDVEQELARRFGVSGHEEKASRA